MPEGVGDILEALGYFIWFWLFIFNRAFRKEWLKKFIDGGWLSRAEMVVEAIGSVICGLILPSALVCGLLLLLLGK